MKPIEPVCGAANSEGAGMRVYAVEHCWCVYESGFEMESIHLTKRGAARAMNSLKSRLHARYVSGGEDYGDGFYMVSIRHEPDFYDMEAFRYRAMEASA